MVSEVPDEVLLQERRHQDLLRERSIALCMGILMWVCTAILLTKAVRKSESGDGTLTGYATNACWDETWLSH